MKLINKFFTVGISTLATVPLITSCVPTSVMTKITNTSEKLYTNYNGESESKREACTVTYIGKDCTADGRPLFARATDCSPKAVHLKLKHYNANELANKTIVGKLGMEYKMPATTLAYTSCPLSDKTSDDPTWATGMWENNGINEMGVGVSATLTCSTNEQFVGYTDENEVFHPATKADRKEEFNKAGVGEELLPIIMAAQATSARNAMEVAAKAIEENGRGAQDANIIFAVDQNEAWLMEIYTRNQYCAVKLPDDKVFVAGNEFILDSLDDLGINASNASERCIVSKGLLSMPVENGIAIFKAGKTPVQEDIYHLDLFNTYAEEGINGKARHSTGADNEFNPRCHMRTWRGYSLFDRTIGLQPETKYDATKKYEPFLTPKNEDGSVRKNLSYTDVINVYRDEFDELVDPTSPRLDQSFVDVKGTKNWRPIAVETTRAIHIMTSDATKPKWIAANEWYTPSSGNYVPFLLINNAMNSIDGEYGYYPERFEFTEDCSAVLFRELNKLGWWDRTNYGLPLQQFWTAFENVYCTQMQQVIDDASKLSKIADAKTIVTNFNKHVRDIYINQVKKTKNDLMWHIMDCPHSKAADDKFVPLIDFEQYVTDLGWSNYKFDGSTVTFDRNNVKAIYKISDGVYGSKGTLTLNGGSANKLKDSVIDGKVYVDMATLNKAILSYSAVKNININDYLNKVNNVVWIVPLVITVALAAGIATYVIIKKKKNKKAAAQQQA